jgi:predicted metal-dependent HD superfamily phosphohydrolase
MEEAEFIRNRWNEIIKSYPSSQETKRNCIEEIIKEYSGKGRFYHNLRHLRDLLESADQFRDQLQDRLTVEFAIFFHDVVYSATGSDNEEKSTELAGIQLHELGVDAAKTQKIKKYILATKNHQSLDLDPDLVLFLDFDLKILASPRTQYVEYTKQIRQEYKIFPDLLYNPGRKKVLKHFLELEHIFKSDFFRQNFEDQARANIQFEISQL